MKVFARISTLFSNLRENYFALNRRFIWLKYVVVFVVIFVGTLMSSDKNIFNYLEMEERSDYINNEIERERALLTTDSLRLKELKGLGKGVENIARERYLMKAPGEQVFIIKKPDSLAKTN